jgi:hypothetical protein
MKSVINSEEVKKLVAAAVEKAINECAFQHQANIDDPDTWNAVYVNAQPKLLKLKFEFEFEFENLSGGKPGWIVCQPVIDLINLDKDK